MVCCIDSIKKKKPLKHTLRCSFKNFVEVIHGRSLKIVERFRCFGSGGAIKIRNQRQEEDLLHSPTQKCTKSSLLNLKHSDQSSLGELWVFVTLVVGVLTKKHFFRNSFLLTTATMIKDKLRRISFIVLLSKEGLLIDYRFFQI